MGCSLTLSLLVLAGCAGRGGGDGETDAEVDAGGDLDAGNELQDQGPTNIGVWCDPRDSDAEGNNPACTGDTTCFSASPPFDDPQENGICAVVGCDVDIWGDQATSNSCGERYSDSVCIDVDGPFGDQAEPYDREDYPDGQNANRMDNICVIMCTPSATSNSCDPHFACSADSTRFNFANPVCLGLACHTGYDCPVSITGNDACASDADCTLIMSGSFCDLRRDTDGDGTLDSGACALPGSCNVTTGACAVHFMGDPDASIGDPCQADVDCPVGGTCVVEELGTDELDRAYRAPRNGYCTLLGCRFPDATGVTCPAGSACGGWFFAGGCMDLCDPTDAAGCRDDLDQDPTTANGIPCDVAGGVVTDCDWYGDFEC